MAVGSCGDDVTPVITMSVWRNKFFIARNAIFRIEVSTSLDHRQLDTGAEAATPLPPTAKPKLCSFNASTRPRRLLTVTSPRNARKLHFFPWNVMIVGVLSRNRTSRAIIQRQQQCRSFEKKVSLWTENYAACFCFSALVFINAN